jgi:hypothetical protein
MKTLKCYLECAVFTFAALVLTFPVTGHAAPLVFSIGGNNTTGSIQTTVDTFRNILGDPNNANNPGPLGPGRREINWDGGGATAPAITASPVLTAFLNIRGALITTPGTGSIQAQPCLL